MNIYKPITKAIIIINIIVFSIGLYIFNSCKSDDDSHLESYTSLVSENDTLITGSTTKITANAVGENLDYLWSASAGDLVGNGSQITYVATPCSIGTNTITCTIKASNKTVTKEIIITVI